MQTRWQMQARCQAQSRWRVQAGRAPSSQERIPNPYPADGQAAPWEGRENKGMVMTMFSTVMRSASERVRSASDRLRMPPAVIQLKIDSIAPNPSQPRKHFDEGEMMSLAASVRQNGILQPLSVRKDDQGRYILIAGERRLRAARLAGLARRALHPVAGRRAAGRRAGDDGKPPAGGFELL